MVRILGTLLLASLAIFLQTGCAAQCASIKNGYAGALEREQGLLDADLSAGNAASHIGVAVSMDALGGVIEQVTGKALSNALKFAGGIPIASGQKLGVDLNGRALNLNIEPDASCKGCFQLAGKLGGSMAVNVPLLGKQNVPLDGNLKLIAPIRMQTGANGAVNVLLDLSKITDQAGTLLTMNLRNLPEAITRSIKAPLIRQLKSELAKNLKPVALFSFQTPDLGVKGLKVFPSEISLMSNALYVGFTTNLPGVAAGQGIKSATVTKFTNGENFAIALQPNVIVNAVSVLMQNGKVPRRYDIQGRAAKEGPAHVTMRGVRVSNRGKERVLGLGFRGWSMGVGPCFWFDALVSGAVRLQNSKLSVDLKEVKLTNASVAPDLLKAIINWKTADFLQETRRLFQTTLATPKLEVPGGSFSVKPSSLGQDPSTLVLRSKIAFKLK